jgi:acyl-CoA thioester hydrolase
MEAVYQFNLIVPDDVVDENRHVNNVAYVKWMQDAAIRHSEATGCTQATLASGATWVVRTHVIEYHRPAFAGEEITVLTWVANFRKVRSLRRYKFIRVKDHAVLARGETDWVFVDAKTGRPRAIPDHIKNAFEIVTAEPEL